MVQVMSRKTQGRANGSSHPASPRSSLSLSSSLALSLSPPLSLSLSHSHCLSHSHSHSHSNYHSHSHSLPLPLSLSGGAAGISRSRSVIRAIISHAVATPCLTRVLLAWGEERGRGGGEREFRPPPPPYTCPRRARRHRPCERRHQTWRTSRARSGGPSVAPRKNTSAGPHPGGNPEANLKSISHRCHPILVAFVWELTK